MVAVMQEEMRLDGLCRDDVHLDIKSSSITGFAVEGTVTRTPPARISSETAKVIAICQCQSFWFLLGTRGTVSPRRMGG